ncbi:hypothetical protein ABZ726_06370 [Streptomyces hundungensis]|uniref:hypothetical protein n=1 Tax=Streptomyces hundungensis TaxID=1077946 RepID=UPI0033C23344
MTPGIRSLTAAVSLTGALLLTPLPYAAAVGTPSPGPPTSASPSGTARPSPRTEPSPRTDPSPQAVSQDQHLAGSRAGEGRTRPGRTAQDFLPDATDAMASDEAVPGREPAEPPPAADVPPPEPPPPTPARTPGGTLPPGRHHRSPQALSGNSDLRVHVLSMGAGLTLTGLGLGFLALRLRRP